MDVSYMLSMLCSTHSGKYLCYLASQNPFSVLTTTAWFFLGWRWDCTQELGIALAKGVSPGSNLSLFKINVLKSWAEGKNKKVLKKSKKNENNWILSISDSGFEQSISVMRLFLLSTTKLYHTVFLHYGVLSRMTCSTNAQLPAWQKPNLQRARHSQSCMTSADQTNTLCRKGNCHKHINTL